MITVGVPRHPPAGSQRRPEVPMSCWSDEIERLRDGAGLPILMVTHDQGEAERLAGQIVSL